MNEEELSNWFEEKKEELLKDYFGKMDGLLIDEEKGEEEKKKEFQEYNPEKVKKVMTKYEKDFLEKSFALRKKYDKGIEKIRAKVKRKALGKTKRERIFKPFVFVGNKIKDFFVWIYQGLIKGKNDISKFFSFKVKLGFLRRKQKISLWMRSTFHPQKLYYDQKIWPILHTLNTPNRILKKKLVKMYDITKSSVKKGFSASIEGIVKSFKWVVEKIKGFFEAIGAFFGKIKGVYTKFVDFFKRVVEVIKMKWFPERDE